jgi:mannitol-1-/sugar-/sorbitol-6-phosphatase
VNRPAKVDLVVFDMDGVLVDSTGCHARAYQDLWKQVGLADPPSYHDLAGVPTDTAVRHYTAALKPSNNQVERWVRFKQERARKYLRRTPAFPDALPVVTALHRLGYKLAVGTGASSITTHQLLSQTGLLAYFPVIVTADDVTAGKPAPETFSRAIEQADGVPDTSVVIEDSVAGLEAGAAAQAWTGSVRTGETVAHPRFLGTFPDIASLYPVITGSRL